MKTKLFTITVFIYCFVSVNEALAQSILRTESFNSVALGKQEFYQIYLPNGYNPADTKRYPVIYFLHAGDVDHTAYSYLKGILDNLINTGKIAPLIMVKPNGNQGNYGGSLYTNSTLYGNIEDYIVNDLVQYIDSIYKTMPVRGKRTIMGHAAGGDGAMRIALVHPNKYTGVATHSSAGDFLQPTFINSFFAAVVQEQILRGESPPYYYQPDNGIITMALFRAAGSWSPNLNNLPHKVDFPLDGNGNPIASVIERWRLFNPAHIVLHTPPALPIGIYFDCGFGNEYGFYGPNRSQADSLTKGRYSV